MTRIADLVTAAHLILATFQDDPTLVPEDWSLHTPLTVEDALDLVACDDDLMEWGDDVAWALAEVLSALSLAGVGEDDRARLLALLDPFAGMDQLSILGAA